MPKSILYILNEIVCHHHFSLSILNMSSYIKYVANGEYTSWLTPSVFPYRLLESPSPRCWQYSMKREEVPPRRNGRRRNITHMTSEWNQASPEEDNSPFIRETSKPPELLRRPATSDKESSLSWSDLPIHFFPLVKNTYGEKDTYN